MEKGRYFIYLSYKGTAYSGWQVQPGEKTIQGIVEGALSTILKADIKVTGAGRTDSGVHASMFVAHFNIPENSSLTADNLAFKLNSILPRDIAISSIIRVKDDAHARFDAVSRTYRYVISLVKNPFGENESTYMRSDPDLKRMNRAASYLFNYDDFTSFSKVHTDVKTNICKIMKAEWRCEDERLIFEIKADRFLRNMVRAIVGTILDIGMGKNRPEDIKQIIEAKERSAAGRSVAPEGLYLVDIEYPETLFTPD